MVNISTVCQKSCFRVWFAVNIWHLISGWYCVKHWKTPCMITSLSYFRMAAEMVLCETFKRHPLWLHLYLISEWLQRWYCVKHWKDTPYDYIFILFQDGCRGDTVWNIEKTPPMITSLSYFRMAPEVILCETLKDTPYDYKADIWSLGKSSLSPFPLSLITLSSVFVHLLIIPLSLLSSLSLSLSLSLFSCLLVKDMSH